MSGKTAQLLELGALIEQMSIETPMQVEIALLALSNIRDLILKDTQPPAVEPYEERGRAGVPMPQVWIQPEPIADLEKNTAQYMEGPGMAMGEPLGFDTLDEEMLEQVKSIPFLYHTEFPGGF